MKHIFWRGLALTVVAGVLGLQVGCSSTDKPKPAELGADPAKMAIRAAWSTKVGAVRFPLQPGVAAEAIAVAGSDGTVALIQSATGADVWRANIAEGITAGTSTDGQTVVVVSSSNDVVALRAANVVWRYRLSARSFTPPLVAGGRVFVLAADRSITALDAQTGKRLWVQHRQQNEALVIQQSGAIFPVGDTLVVGLSGRLSGLNPANGSSRWDVPISFARGGNDIERLVDIVGPVSRVGGSVCARAFQAALGCIDAERGLARWSMLSRGAVGVTGDSGHVYSAEADGKIQAWARATGDKSWTNDSLLHRGLSAPVVVGGAVVVGDAMGFVHWLAAADGTPLGRVQVDQTPVVAQPLAVGNQVIVVTRAGTVASYTQQ